MAPKKDAGDAAAAAAAAALRLKIERKVESARMQWEMADVTSRLRTIKRYHARLRRRLKKTTRPIHSKWGRCLPENRISVDQVPCNLREGDGSKQDDGKLICTLQIAARAKNGVKQPRIGVIFRGLGKCISQQERSAWDPRVDVRFQQKAWADREYCLSYAEDECRVMTKAARQCGAETWIFCDNLYGQTTPEHRAALKKQDCVRHLLPGGNNDELQLIDDGVGYATKNAMGHALDTWLEEECNLEMWTAENGRDFPAWKKRALLTKLAADAWDHVCDTFDFDSSARRIGMLMTIDGTDDNKILPQGIASYSFCDEDGGSEGAASDLEQPEG